MGYNGWKHKVMNMCTCEKKQIKSISSIVEIAQRHVSLNQRSSPHYHEWKIQMHWIAIAIDCKG